MTVLSPARHYTLSSTLTCGYNFLKKVYYVTNKSYTTEREDKNGETAWKALCAITNTDITATQVTVGEGENSKTLTKDNFLLAKDTVESISSLYYTYSDDGAYIKSIRINDYEDYLLVIDCEKDKLYIKNTNTIYDLTINEADIVKIEYITLFYKQQLGLGHIVNNKDILIEDIKALYNKLLSYYVPTVYNSIEKSKDNAEVLVYNNTISLSNFKGNGRATYDITCNPNGDYETIDVANIKAASVSENTFTLTGTPNETINVGDKIYVTNANNVVENVTYSADGEYTVKAYDSNNAIVEVNENMPYSYKFPYRECYLSNSGATITNISRTNSSITLSTTVPNTIKVGDTIVVNRTTQTEQSESITDDGEYQVQSFAGNTLYVYPEPKYNYSYSSGDQGYIEKQVYLGNITKIERVSGASKLTLDRTINSVANNSNIRINTGSAKKWYKTTASTDTTITFKNTDGTDISSTDINYIYDPNNPNDPNGPTYGKLQKHGNSLLLLLNITSCKKENLLPLGELMLDNLDSLKKYLSIYSGVLQPTSDNTNAIGTNVSTTKEVTMGDGSTIYMQLEGLYSEKYPEK